MSTSLFWRFGAFFSGILIGGCLPSHPGRLSFLFLLVSAYIFRHKDYVRKPLIILALLFLGLSRNQGTTSNQSLARYYGKKQAWEFWVCADPEPDWNGQGAVLCPLPPSFAADVEGAKAVVKLPLYPPVGYGDVLSLKCRLEKPPGFADFDYAAYLAARGVSATCSWPEIISATEGMKGSGVMRGLYRLKRSGLKILERNLPEPAAGLASALLLGYKHTLFSEDEKNFQQAGLSHIVAISGGHISLFIELSISFAVFIGINRRRAIWPALGLAGIYVLITGIQASAWRSLLMGAIMLYAWRRGRLQSAWLPLCWAAAVMLYQNPLLWRYDLGFQLSFLAIGGMIAFNPIMATKIYPYESSFRRFWQILGSAFKLSLSAQIAVWPLLALTSGGISLISPFTNVLAFWVFGPLVISLLGSLIISAFLGASIMVWAPAYWLLQYLLLIGRWGANIPFGYIPVPWFKGWMAGIYYIALILFLILKGKRKETKKRPFRDALS